VQKGIKPTKFELVFGIDDDDAESEELIKKFTEVDHVVVKDKRMLPSERMNLMAKAAKGTILMLGADDIVFQTAGWDERIRETFSRYPDRITYVSPNDLDKRFNGKIGTHGCVSRRWIDELGWVAHPRLNAYYIDTYITVLAKLLGRYVWLPDVIIEHKHPQSGKPVENGITMVDTKDFDEVYAENNKKYFEKDRMIFEWLCYDGLEKHFHQLQGVLEN
jgi:hypothetical protein